ncbi:aquaporin family protein [Nesterenkonia sp. YGD6]|uniref:MIP/aquaporin family protein n=1 Tax=Nesterenkonia sp. YGD6 TaxID=2901231 RepID=UPI001F4D0F08|nr:MIP/aquaporin family protein [Nesterenkonia sp. YGD6]MCH8562137.1 aquaporin family protein [Nesterenkonia sp. YGD6]
MSLEAFVAETFGTMLLLLLGCGVVANAVLRGTKGNNGGFLMINFGWGLGVFAGVYVAALSGAHLNPAVTVGLLVNGDIETLGPDIEKSALNVVLYFAAQLLGAMIGAFLCYLSYKKHFDAEPDPGAKLAVFATGPAIRSSPWNLMTEIIGTFVLVFVIIAFAGTPSGLGPLAVALLVVGIGASLGGPTGYAINPTRDLGPRIVHALLPIKGKGGSDWSYAWVPIIGPLIGGALGGLLAMMVTLPVVNG